MNPEQPNFSTGLSVDFVKHCRKAKEEEEEMVKYMSNLPKYLERGDAHQEKVLNVGVLDWDRLQKYRSRRHSVSNACSSSTLSTEWPSNVGSCRDMALRSNAESGSSHGKTSDVKKSTPTSTYPNAKEPSTGFDPKLSKSGMEKPRTSSFRRLAISVGNIGKTFSSKESSAVQNLSTNGNCARFTSENSKGTSRARSSSLRRLLDPLLKPKEVKFDMARCTDIDFENPSREKKPELSSFRALLRVAVKNGQPVFTFAVNNDFDVLAATLKMLSSSSSDGYNCVYNFFAIQEAKKKNERRIKRGSKDKSENSVPNIVAQLKVSGARVIQISREELFKTEFVLLGVDLGQADEQALPGDELAAIIVKIPKVSASSISATFILPSGVHTIPNRGEPSSLIQRWISGGSCDCGGWDLGCKLQVFSNQNQLLKKPRSSMACSVADKFELIAQGAEEENGVVFRMSLFKDGIYSVEFASRFSILQAFSLCIAVLDSKKVCEISESSNL